MRPLVPVWTRHVLWGGFDLTLGLVLLLGSPGRVAGPSFDGPKMAAGYLGGDIGLWGVAFTACGLALLSWPLLLTSRLAHPIGREFTLRVTYIVTAALLVFWAAALAVAAVRDSCDTLVLVPGVGFEPAPCAAWTGPCVYLAVTLAHLLAAFGKVE